MLALESGRRNGHSPRLADWDGDGPVINTRVRTGQRNHTSRSRGQDTPRRCGEVLTRPDAHGTGRVAGAPVWRRSGTGGPRRHITSIRADSRPISVRASRAGRPAPLHNPPSLAALAAAERSCPGVPHVGGFDTAFHATLPPEDYTYPVRKWSARVGMPLCRFHGLVTLT